jgi:putative hemolysin
MKIILLFLIILILIIGCSTEIGPVEKPEKENIEIANPASVYCEEQGGTVDIRTNEDGDQIGFCIFDDGSECEEWEFYRGGCEK